MHSTTPVARKAQARRPKPSPKFLEQFYTWLYQVHHDPEFAPSALAILLEIAWPMSSLGQYSWPSFETIAEKSGLSKTSVIRLVQQLVARSHLIAEGGSAGRGHSTHYRINIIGAASAPVTSPKVIVADVLDRDPTPLNGTLTGPLDTEPRSLKGTLTDLLGPGTGSIKGPPAYQNKKERKKELKERVFKTTDIENAGTHSLDRPPESLGHVTPVQDTPPNPAITTDLAATVSLQPTKTVDAPIGVTTKFEKDQRSIDRPSMPRQFFAKRDIEQIGNTATPQIEATMPKPNTEPRDLAADHAEAAANPTTLRALTREQSEKLAWRRNYFDRLRLRYPIQPFVEAAEVEVLLSRMLLDQKSFLPLFKTVQALEADVAAGHVERAKLPALKYLLEKNWMQVHGDHRQAARRAAAR
jgi:Helix-turn-helix domain